MNKKILVVDDDKNICELLGLYLKKENYQVVFAYDGSEAVTKAKEQVIRIMPGLIFLTINAITKQINNVIKGINFLFFIFLIFKDTEMTSIIMYIALNIIKTLGAAPNE